MNEDGSSLFHRAGVRIDGLDTLMRGKSLSRHIESLDEAARELGVRPLSDFVSIDPEQVADFLDDEGEEGFDMPALRQFKAEEGLATVRALAAHPAAQAKGVAEDLRDCERILGAAAQNGVGWHFEVDF
jgi:hypothetical protein